MDYLFVQSAYRSSVHSVPQDKVFEDRVEVKKRESIDNIKKEIQKFIVIRVLEYVRFSSIYPLIYILKMLIFFEELEGQD